MVENGGFIPLGAQQTKFKFKDGVHPLGPLAPRLDIWWGRSPDLGSVAHMTPCILDLKWRVLHHPPLNPLELVSEPSQRFFIV